MLELLEGRWRHRGMKTEHRTRLTIPLILAWADAFHERNGFWPTLHYGPMEGIPGGEGETWSNIDSALVDGRRGLPGGITLSQLLQRRRGHDPQHNRPRPPLRRPRLSVAQVLRWVDAYVDRHGRFPSVVSGMVDPFAADSEPWWAIDEALRTGKRGLPGGMTLQTFMEAHRAKLAGSHTAWPSVPEILAALRHEHARTGIWPKRGETLFPGYPHINWTGVDNMLRAYGDGEAPFMTLAMLKTKHFGFRNTMRLPPLTIERVLEWADAHHKRHGRWPIAKGTSKHKAIEEAPGETWPMINRALRRGQRGLPALGGLPELLMEHRGVRNKSRIPPLTIEQILAWADRHHERTGQWPDANSGPVSEAPGETWGNVASAMVAGLRSLGKGMTLAKLLAKHRGVRHPMYPPPLTITQILAWADAHYRRTGDWPGRTTGVVVEQPDESWGQIDWALNKGKRGLGPRDRAALATLLHEHRMPMYARKGWPLKRSEILDWAAAHHALTGSIPTADSGPVLEVAGETWAAIDASLRTGSRGWRGTITLAEFLAESYVPVSDQVGALLTEARIIAWAESFKERVGHWPTAKSAYTDPTRTETWQTIDAALRKGCRGLPGGSSLFKLLTTHRKRPVENRS